MDEVPFVGTEVRMSALVLYRLYNADSELLYVGITNNIHNRLRQHAQKAVWWGDVVHCASMIGFESRAELERAELEAIKSEEPWYNTVGNDHRRMHPIERERQRLWNEVAEGILCRTKPPENEQFGVAS